MKKFMLFALMAITAVMGMRAEEGDLSVAPEFAFGSKCSQPGVGLQIMIEPAGNWRIAPELILYFKNKNRTERTMVRTSAPVFIFPRHTL